MISEIIQISEFISKLSDQKKQAAKSLKSQQPDPKVIGTQKPLNNSQQLLSDMIDGSHHDTHDEKQNLNPNPKVSNPNEQIKPKSEQVNIRWTNSQLQPKTKNENQYLNDQINDKSVGISKSQKQAQNCCSFFEFLRTSCLILNFSLPIAILFLDQVTDIGYFITKWNQFYSQELRSLTIYFALNQMFSLACYYSMIDFYIFSHSSCGSCMGSKGKDKGQTVIKASQGSAIQPNQTAGTIEKEQQWSFKLWKFLLSIIALPFYVGYLALKLHQILNKVSKFYYEKYLDQSTQSSADNKKKLQDKKLTKTWTLLYLIILDCLMQSLPQTIVQSINNSNVQDWDKWALVSLFSSIIVIFYSIIQVSNDALAETKSNNNNNTEPKKFAFKRFLSMMKDNIHSYLIPLYILSLIVGALVSAFAAPGLEYKSAILGIGVSMAIVIVGNVLLLFFKRKYIKQFCDTYKPIPNDLIKSVLKMVFNNNSKGIQNQEKKQHSK